MYILQAHASYEEVHNMDIEDANTDVLLQLTMFMNRLSGSTIGLTVLKMFVIDKPTILTVSTIDI